MNFLIDLARKINLHVLLVGLGGLLVAGGPVAYVLTSFDVTPAMQASILQRAGGLIGLALAIGAIVRMAMSQTDKGKAKTLAGLDDESQQRVIAKMATEDQVALVQNTVKTLNGTASPELREAAAAMPSPTATKGTPAP